MTPQLNGNAERKETCFESSGGLALNATSMITVTTKNTEEDLKTTRRLKTSSSNTKYDVQVCLL